jgi:hypothetical protein
VTQQKKLEKSGLFPYSCVESNPELFSFLNTKSPSLCPLQIARASVVRTSKKNFLNGTQKALARVRIGLKEIAKS